MREVLSSFVMGRCLRSRRDGATEQEKEREKERQRELHWQAGGTYVYILGNRLGPTEILIVV